MKIKNKTASFVSLKPRNHVVIAAAQRQGGAGAHGKTLKQLRVEARAKIQKIQLGNENEAEQ